MISPFNINYEWLHSDDGNTDEQATLAEIAITTGEYCATEVEDILAKSVRSYARLSAIHLSEWFASNWWRLLWEPEDSRSKSDFSWRVSHRIGNAGNGYVWPDLSFSSDWQSVEVKSKPTPRLEAEPIRYLNPFETHISIAEFEKGMGDFIDGTIARLSSVSKGQFDLSVLWHEVIQERHNPDVAQWRMLEACMGYDPDEAPDGLVDSLLRQADSYGAKAIQEVAPASKTQTISHINELCDAARGSDGISVHIPSYDNIRQRLRIETDPSDIPWRRAERAAQIAREVWDVSVPISTDQLSDLFHITEKQFSDSRSTNYKSLIAGFRPSDSSDSFQISWNSNYQTSRRFALARIVSDNFIASDNENLLPGTRSMTSRQKFQRAFAQEFLCPFETLKEELNDEKPNSDDVHRVADHFDVSPLTVLTTLVNKGILEQQTRTDWVV